MAAVVPDDVTRVLRRVSAGDRRAVEELLPMVYRELHDLAARQMAGERADHTLQSTALLNEAYLRLFRNRGTDWQDRRHFYRTAAVVMRTILVNHARDRKRQKRGGGMGKLPLQDHFATIEERAIDLVALDEALRKLETLDPRQTEMIELRFFAGLTVRETAETLQVSERTVEADWSLARAWLLRELRSG